MPTDEKDIVDLYEERIKEKLEELGRMSKDDQNREKVQKEIDMLSKNHLSYVELEQNRLNNNAKNDNEEQKLLIENEKIKVDKKKIFWSSIASIVVPIFSIGTGTYVHFRSYHMEEEHYPDKEIKSHGINLIERWLRNR